MVSEKHIYELTALESLFKRFYKPLRAYAFHFVNDMELAEDIVQDTFFELWSRRDMIEFDGAVKSYLFKSVYNRSLNVLNKKYQNKEFSLDKENEQEIYQGTVFGVGCKTESGRTRHHHVYRYHRRIPRRDRGGF